MGTLSSWLLCLFSITHHFFSLGNSFLSVSIRSPCSPRTFPFQTLNSIIFPRIPHSLNYLLVFRIKILVLGVLIATGVSLLLGPLNRKEWEVYAGTYKSHTHKCICVGILKVMNSCWYVDSIQHHRAHLILPTSLIFIFFLW